MGVIILRGADFFSKYFGPPPAGDSLSRRRRIARRCSSESRSLGRPMCCLMRMRSSSREDLDGPGAELLGRFFLRFSR